ncbi:MAG: S41 family peptidase [Myxococcota bacterium]|nr:S41 family peptidase [Myxococcota bacterium]
MRTRMLASFCLGLGIAAGITLFGDATRSEASSRYDDLGLFSSVLDHVRRHYVEPIGEHDLLAGAIRGMMRELDPHSSFMEPDQYEEMQVDTKGEFHGLGIEVHKTQGGYIEVVSPIEGTPADRAGIRARDQIVEICPTEVPEDWEDGEECRPTMDMTLIEAVSLMRGEKDTEITVRIYREGFDEPRDFTVIRDVVQMASVTGELLETGYGYLRIRQFQERTAQDLQDEIDALLEESATDLEGVVLDLRDNPGGLLDQAVQVSNLWLSEGLIVYTQGRDEAQRQDFRAFAVGTEGNYPIVVVVNGGSASASEIVAGALQDQKRALVLGTRTFGKGSVQTVFPIGTEYGLRLTTGLYYTPSGRSIQEIGIQPDIEVHVAVADATSQPQRIRESDLQGHFTHEDADPDDADPDLERSSGVSGSEEIEDDEGSVRVRSDVQVRRALEVLKSWTYFENLRGPAESAESAIIQATAQ